MERTGSKHTSCRKLDENSLISLAKNSNEAAFMEIFDRYKSALKIHLGKIVAASDVEDICLQTFLKAFLHINSFDCTKAEFRTWLFKIGWNTALDHVGKKQRENDYMPTTSIDCEQGKAAGISTDERSPEENISNQEDYDKLIRYIEGLSPLYRDIAKDRFIEECDYNEIAEKYQLPINTIKTRIKRSKEILQKMMLDNEDEI